MPKKPLDPNLILEPAPPVEPSTWDQMGGWAGAGAAGIRGVSGLIGMGGPTGAIASGGGEALAQLMEFFGGIGPEQTLAQRLGRIVTEGAIGAVPFANVAKKGQLLRNLLRGGALSGTGEAARELLTSGEVNPLSVGMAAGIGGGSGAGVQGLADLLTGAGRAAPKAVQPDIIPTSQTARAPRATARAKGAPAPPQAPTTSPVVPEAPSVRTPEEIAADFARVADEDPSVAGVPYNTPTVPSRSTQRVIEEEAKAAAKLAEAKAARAEIENALAQGLEPQAPVVSRTVTEKVPGGKRSATTRYTEPNIDEEAGGARELASILGVEPSAVTSQGGSRRFVPVPAEQVSSPVVAEPVSDFGQLILNQGQPFRSRVDAAGAGYRGAKAAGDVPPDVVGKVHGRALQREGQEAGLPPGGPVPPTAPQPAVPEDWVQKELGVVEKLKQLMRDQSGGGTLANPKPGRGFVYPEIPTHIASAALGGLLGVATDPFGNPLLSGLTGVAAGGLLPAAPALMREGGAALTDLAEKGRESLGNLPDFGESILQGIEKIPNFQRFNLLASVPGLASNAVLGPYGSAVMGALERGLAGDTRGWNALRELANPVQFARNMWANRDEALELLRKGELGRDEAINPGLGENLVDTGLALPGWAMTAGDVTARRALQKAGFLEDEARKMTLTSEPTTGLGRTIAHFGSGGDNTVMDRLLKVGTNLVAPFRRTPANIMERGLERLPGVGALVQGASGNATAREIAVQQAMGAGLMGAGYLAGENIDDPTVSREARRALSNISGQYSLPTSLGFAIGRSRNEALPAQRPGTITNELFPLPTTDNLTQIGRTLFGQGQQSRTPRGAIPAVLRERLPFIDSEPLFPQEEEPDTIPNLPTFRRR